MEYETDVFEPFTEEPDFTEEEPDDESADKADEEALLLSEEERKKRKAKARKAKASGESPGSYKSGAEKNEGNGYFGFSRKIFDKLEGNSYVSRKAFDLSKTGYAGGASEKNFSPQALAIKALETALAEKSKPVETSHSPHNHSAKGCSCYHK
jgi:hypothetical protein